MKNKFIAEQTLLASIIFDNNSFAATRALIGPDDFSQDLHRIIYEAMLEVESLNIFLRHHFPIVRRMLTEN